MGIFFFWSLIYTVVLTELPYLKTQGVKPLLINTVIDSLSGWFHYWFLFLICGLYLVLPFIEIIVNHISGKLLRYYIILNIVFCFIGKTLMSLSFFNEIFGTHLDDFLVGFLNIYTFYFMLGYWLKDCSFKKDKLLWAGMCAGLLFNAIVGNITSFLSGDRMVSLIDAQSPSTLLVCVCLFMLSRKIEITDDRAKRIIALLSELSFGVYLIHMLIIEIMKKFFPLIGSPFAACIVTVSVTTFIGFGISWILWKNRITRRVIR